MSRKGVFLLAGAGLLAYAWYENQFNVSYDNYLTGDDGDDGGNGGFIAVSAGYVRDLVMGKASDLVSENYKGLLPVVENGIRAGFKNGKWYQYTDNKNTIGFGHVILPKENFKNGITTSEAYDLMLKDIDLNCYPVVPYKSILTQGQFDALCDFCYNAGPPTFNRKVKKYLIAGQVSQAIEATVKHYADISVGKNINFKAGWQKRSKIQQNMAGRNIYSANV